jgi:hypothetical protein
MGKTGPGGKTAVENSQWGNSFKYEAVIAFSLSYIKLFLTPEFHYHKHFDWVCTIKNITDFVLS